MTKKELIEALNGLPDDTEVKVYLTMSGYEDPGAVADIKLIHIRDCIDIPDVLIEPVDFAYP